MNRHLPRKLDPHEIRVLGCLLEKEQATPEYYPLTVKALVAACNQKSSREPVMKLSEDQVIGALKRLRRLELVERIGGSRAERWRQVVDRGWGLDAPSKAALTVLLLRGPQTSGEVRGRSGRLHEFATSAEAESALADLAAPPEPVVMLQEREQGQKEARWAHCIGGGEPTPATVGAGAAGADSGVAERDRPAETPGSGAVGASGDREAIRQGERPFDADLVLRRLDRLEQQVRELEAAVHRKFGFGD